MNAPGLHERLRRRLRGGGVRWLVEAIVTRVFPPRPAMRSAVVKLTQGAHGLEIGGPSPIFGPRGALPIYASAARMDNINFATTTAWEQHLLDGAPFQFHPRRAPGVQWLREATALTGVKDGEYDFVASSHCLEHVANPLAALREWHRATRVGGHLVLVLPDPAKTFDHRRPITSLAHLQADFDHQTSEDDTTHRDEILALHDIARDAGVGSAAEFRERSADNAAQRCLHHHVFDSALMSAALQETGWHVLAVQAIRPLHLAALARKNSP